MRCQGRTTIPHQSSSYPKLARYHRAHGYMKYRCSRVKEPSSNALVQDKALKSSYEKDPHLRLLLWRIKRVGPPRLCDPGTRPLVDDPVLKYFPIALLRLERTFGVCSQQRAPERIDDLELPRQLRQESIITFFMGSNQPVICFARCDLLAALGK